MGKTVIEVNNLNKTFRVGEQDVQVLKDINFTISEGEFVIIIGPSGSGKSTILYSLLGLEPPTSGTVRYFGEDIYDKRDEDMRTSFRKKHIGMVYQQANWVRSLTVCENVSFPMKLMGFDDDEAKRAALSMLSKVGMEDWADYLPSELSGGQQQRVALSRALINDPQVIIADEPTGNLDYRSGENVMNLLSQIRKDANKTIVMVTHDLDYLRYAEKAIRIFDGAVAGIYNGNEREKLVSDLKSKNGSRFAEEEENKENDKNDIPERESKNL